MRKILSSLIVFCLLFSLLHSIPQVNALYFVDVQDDHIYYEAISYLREHGIIQGYENRTFKPEQKINRAETLKILLLGSNISVSESNSKSGFYDVKADHWFAKYVIKAKHLGIIKGNPDGGFAPERTVNLAEALKMIILTNTFVVSDKTLEDPFTDVFESTWFAKYFAYAGENHLFSVPSNSKIYPSQDMTRGYLAHLMYKAIIHKREIVQERQLASFYSDIFDGRTTASGDIFDNNLFTAAHRTLPFGTKLRVINVYTGDSVIVIITDRGPYVENRVLDLSKIAFQKIAPLSSGVVPIVYEVIGDLAPEDNSSVAQCDYPSEREFIDTDYFEGIKLDKPLPSIFIQHEVFPVRGKLLTEKAYVTASLFIDESPIHTFSMVVDDDGSFELPIFFQEEGSYELAIIPGRSGNSRIHPVQILTEDCTQSNYEAQASTPKNVQVRLEENESRVYWDLKEESLTRIRVSDGEKERIFIVNNHGNSFIVPYHLFQEFSEGEAFLEVASAFSTSSFSIDRSSHWVYGKRVPLHLTKHRLDEVKEEYIDVLSFTNQHFNDGEIQLKSKISSPVKTRATLIFPNGFTEKIPLSSDMESQTNEHDLEFFPAGSTISFNYKVLQRGTYIVSIYGTNGESIFNYPSYNTEETPFLPDFFDLSERMPLEQPVEISKLRLELFELVNFERKIHGLESVELFDNLNELAQARSQDMVRQDYFSHYTPKGKDVNGLRLLYNIKTPLKENIAKDSSVEFIHHMLMRSPDHRTAILDENVSRIGIGIEPHSDGTLIVTELFSEDPISLEDLTAKREEILKYINHKRLSENIPELRLDGILNPIAQNWSDHMAQDDFCDGKSPDGSTINELIEESGTQLRGGMTRFLCNTSYDDALESIYKHSSAFDLKFDTVGIGVIQDLNGIIRFVIIFADQ